MTRPDGPSLAISLALACLATVSAQQNELTSDPERRDWTAASLTRDLGSDDVRVRRIAALRSAKQLADAPDEELTSVVAGLATSEPDRYIRGRCLIALAGLRDPQHRPLLLAALDDEDSGVVTAAIQAVGIAGLEAAIPRLRGWLDDDRQARHAANALAAIPDPEAYPWIASRLRRDRARPGGIYTYADAAFTLDTAAAIELAVELLRDPGTPENHGFGRRLADVPDAFHALVREQVTDLVDDDNPSVRTAAIRALGGTGDLKSVSLLLQRLEAEPVVKLRTETARALGALGHEFAAEPLGRIALDAENPLRAAAVAALAEIGHVLCVEPLDALLRAHGDADELLAVHALHGLGRTGSPTALPIVARHLDDTRVVGQPALMSRVASFPMNVRISDVAAWAALTLLDGTPPCAVQELSSFPTVNEVFDDATRNALAERIQR